MTNVANCLHNKNTTVYCNVNNDVIYKCETCGVESRVPFYPQMSKLEHDEIYKQWEFHQSFLVELCSILHLDFCLENEQTLLKKIKGMIEDYEIDLTD